MCSDCRCDVWYWQMYSSCTQANYIGAWWNDLRENILGGTLIETGKALLDLGAVSVSAFCTHGVCKYVYVYVYMYTYIYFFFL